MSAASGAGPGSLPGTAARERPADLRSAELVSRLLAATPPYLYNMPIVPHSYFFSEMLRSFVHAKNNAEANRIAPQNAPQPPTHRRSRKRSWNQSKISPIQEGTHMKPEWQQRSEHWQMRNATHEDRHQYYDEKFSDVALDSNKNHQYEKPLELTTHKSLMSKHSNFRTAELVAEVDEKRNSPDVEVQMKMRKSPKVLDTTSHLKDEKFPNLLPPTAPVPPALTLPPPPPPLWYPPLYPPPYGIDPLNFFIDLRVSGHIYDRKHGNKEAQNSSLVPNNQEAPQQEVQPSINTGPLVFENGNTSAFKENMKANRHVSAFSVPKPRDGIQNNSKNFPINLCHNSNNKFNMKYYDDVDSKLNENQAKNTTNTHYVMHNLKRIYNDLTNHPEDNVVSEEGKVMGEPETTEDLDGANDSDSSETKKKRCKDLRALIGLELVVDYVKGGKGGGGSNGAVGGAGGGEGPSPHDAVVIDEN